jgi:DNA primase
MSNLLILNQEDGRTFKKVSTTNGGEYSGQCPFCGGQDRFRVWPNHNGGRYWCRSCGKQGDTIQYLRDFRGLSYKAARLLIGKQQRPAAFPPSAAQSEKKSDAVHSAIWSEQAANYQETFQDALWSEQGTDALAFLYSKGLTDDSIKAAGIGYNCIDRYRDRADFGLSEQLNDNGNQKKVWIPEGIVIPLIIDGHIVRLRVRRTEADADSKYILVTGSDTAPMIFSSDRARASACIIVESELDALLINQVAGDIVDCVALGSAQAKPDTVTENLLRQAKLILIALDADEAGARASHLYWLPTYPNARRWPVAIGKDPSDAYQQGMSIRQWIEAGVPVDAKNTEPGFLIDGSNVIPFPSDWHRFTEEQLERLSIMTMDGGLSDDEAVNYNNRG